MNSVTNVFKNRANRRSFLKRGLTAAGAAAAGAQLLADGGSDGGQLNQGDAAILRFHAALEILETDFWEQYNELGGVQDKELPGGSGSPVYTAALTNLDSDMAQYIHDNTEDEFTHQNFLNAYLASKGIQSVSLEPFRTLPGSTATGSSGKMRLTNLMQLTLDTSWYTRYRSRNQNPDLDPNFKFPQAVAGLATGEWTAIPRTDADLTPTAHIQAIANTAAFHFATVEQGGSSLYPQHAQRATSSEVLRILLSIGPTETSHFQTWHDKAGNAVATPLAPLTDPTNGLVFPDLNSPPFGGENFQTNLIMPEPCPFLSTSLPACSIIRPTATAKAASGALAFLTAMGLFKGQSAAFFNLMGALAAAADAAQRGMGG
ncbi:MAG TPA: ferritin-like domain-containing protein [Bryobacteraceae bacterium]|nr:ferritin-like domain-containing protein [Bryobacteraceae bacterium]